MNNPKHYPDFASAEPALLRGEAVAIPIGASLEGTFATLEPWISGYRARILEPGKRPFYHTPGEHEWIETKGDLVRIVNREYPGVTYVSGELFNTKAQEAASIQVMERLYDAVQASLDEDEEPLHVGGRVLICMGEESGKLGTVYNHLPSRPAPWHVRPDGWSADEPGIAYTADELQPTNA